MLLQDTILLCSRLQDELQHKPGDWQLVLRIILLRRSIYLDPSYRKTLIDLDWDAFMDAEITKVSQTRLNRCLVSHIGATKRHLIKEINKAVKRELKESCFSSKKLKEVIYFSKIATCIESLVSKDYLKDDVRAGRVPTRVTLFCKPTYASHECLRKPIAMVYEINFYASDVEISTNLVRNTSMEPEVHMEKERERRCGWSISSIDPSPIELSVVTQIEHVPESMDMVK
ncbi:hypothetical protein BpHYR1_037566 [Brachionus plicatilis]|uniref:Uncharacterized protein n=1 Tax=Brachionus plicatilis TaxID=10195 RepID=A0A3M7RA22_BRAPC|nr:hypothetical protein BpHYR1_037566 [Brachionus plicatilis]